jgi:hypothetical protein
VTLTMLVVSHVASFAAGALTGWGLVQYSARWRASRSVTVPLIAAVAGLVLMVIGVQAQVALNRHEGALRLTQCRQALVWVAVIDREADRKPPITDEEREFREDFRSVFADVLTDLDCDELEGELAP